MSFNVEATPVLTQDQIATGPDEQAYASVPPLKTMYLYVSGACNLACRHCWISPQFLAHGSAGGEYLSVEHVAKAIQEAKPLGLMSVKLTGGEPTLHPQFREMVTMIHEAEIGMSIETNATLIDDDLAQFMQSHGITFVATSVDGATAATHEALRNVPGSFQQVVDGIQALVRAGYKPQMICTLHQGNVAEMDQIVALAQELQCGSVKFNHVQKVGRGKAFGADNGFTVEEIIALYHRVEDDLNPNNDIPVLFDIPLAFYPIRRLLSTPATCHIQHILGILADGSLSLCGIGVTIPDLIYGHLDHDNVADVWRTSTKLASLREQIPAQLDGVCGQCLFRDLCQGHCVANNYVLSGRLNAPFQFCHEADALGLFPASRKQ